MTLFVRFPRATIAVLDSVGHNLQIESEEVFEAHVNDWLWRVEAAHDLIDMDLDTEICANCGYEDALYDVKLSAQTKAVVYTCENCGCSYSSDEKTLNLKFYKGMKMDWEEYFRTKLTYPLTCVITEYQERGPLQQGDELAVHGVEHEDDFYGILLNTRKGRKKYVFPACDLEVKEGGGEENIKALHNYCVWFANCR